MIHPTENVLTNTTHAVAVGAVSAPLWLPSLTQISNFAALCMPILGALWLLIQIARAFWNWKQN
jgi:hypothetical protein